MGEDGAKVKEGDSVITFWGTVVAVVFVVCYLGQSISSGMESGRGRILQWACWTLASTTMLVCYLLT